jgi:hypothetical protein
MGFGFCWFGFLTLHQLVWSLRHLLPFVDVAGLLLLSVLCWFVIFFFVSGSLVEDGVRLHGSASFWLILLVSAWPAWFGVVSG